jgi:hypothetical protein
MLLALTLCGTVALAACAEQSARHAPTPSPTLPPRAKIVAHAGDTQLCTVVSPAEFARVTGLQATQVEAGVTSDTLTGLQDVQCEYLDASDPAQLVGRGTINFEVAGDAQSAARTLETVKQSFTGVTDINDVGDAAFTGSPGGAASGTGLVVLRGTMLLYLSIGGEVQTVAHITEQLALLVLSRVVS